MKAIILAAGMGTRLRPLTSDTPKPLVKVNGKPIIERQIEYLREKNITDITVVVGYLKEKFTYLRDKYNVELVFNHNYAEYNNIYSMYLVRDLLPNSYVLEGDIFIEKNVFQYNHKNSKYYCVRRHNFKNECVVVTDGCDDLLRIDVRDGDGLEILTGISYWNKTDGEFIAKKIDEAIRTRDFTNLFWDDIVYENISRMKIKVVRLHPFDCYEIDSVNDLRFLESILM